jgi:hypothetical protein
MSERLSYVDFTDLTLDETGIPPLTHADMPPRRPHRARLPGDEDRSGHEQQGEYRRPA